METRYVAIYRLPGIFGLPSENDFELLKSADGARAFLTTQHAKYIEHIRIRSALGVIFAGLFATPGQAPKTLPPASEQLRDALARIQTPNMDNSVVLLIVEVAGTETKPNLDHLQDLGLVGARIQIFDERPYLMIAENALRTAFAGLSLALPDDTTDSILPLGSVAFGIEQDTGRILYSTSVQMTATVTSSIHLQQSSADEAKKMITAMQGCGLGNSIRLLAQSSEGNKDRLASFLSAWTALELFVQKVFSSTYEAKLYAEMSSAMRSSAAIFLNHIEEVMSKKYNIRHKFVAIASILNDAEAEADIVLFSELKKRRDELAHTMKDDSSTLPADSARRLLRKYLRLHLSSRSSP